MTPFSRSTVINRSSFKCARARWRVRDCIRIRRFLTRAMTTRFALLCGFALCGISSAFVGLKPRASLRRAPVRAMVNIPRISLPDQVSEIIKQQDLKSPNELSDSEYNTYSAAAIGGTLVLLLPIAALDGALFGFLKDFVISALLGGGLLAYLALRKDGLSEQANKFGGLLMGVIDKVAS